MFGHVDYESHLLGRILSCSPETPMKRGEIFAPLWDSEARRQGRGELMKKGLPCGHLVFLWAVGKTWKNSCISNFWWFQWIKGDNRCLHLSNTWLGINGKLPDLHGWVILTTKLKDLQDLPLTWGKGHASYGTIFDIQGHMSSGNSPWWHGLPPLLTDPSSSNQEASRTCLDGIPMIVC